jgi:hypothetical protein
MYKERLKRFDLLDIGLIKLTSFSVALLFVSFFTVFAKWVQSVNPLYFLIAVAIFAARPAYKFFSK